MEGHAQLFLTLFTFGAGFLVAQTVLELTMWLRMTLNSRFS